LFDIDTDGYLKILVLKIWPENRGAPENCVGSAPEQKITQLPFTASANQQINIRALRTV
jgi:hypothetical protein